VPGIEKNLDLSPFGQFGRMGSLVKIRFPVMGGRKGERLPCTDPESHAIFIRQFEHGDIFVVSVCLGYNVGNILFTYGALITSDRSTGFSVGIIFMGTPAQPDKIFVSRVYRHP
jgi:hypothetical protein